MCWRLTFFGDVVAACMMLLAASLSSVVHVLSSLQSSGPCISLVFVEVVGRGTRSTTLSTSDSFEAWDRLQRLRDWSKKGNFVLVGHPTKGGHRYTPKHISHTRRIRARTKYPPPPPLPTPLCQDLIDNKPTMFDSQLRCWLRDSSLRQACALRLPATETFSGVVIEVS